MSTVPNPGSLQSKQIIYSSSQLLAKKRRIYTKHLTFQLLGVLLKDWLQSQGTDGVCLPLDSLGLLRTDSNLDKYKGLRGTRNICMS